MYLQNLVVAAELRRFSLSPPWKIRLKESLSVEKWMQGAVAAEEGQCYPYFGPSTLVGLAPVEPIEPASLHRLRQPS
jgi:hypothetical protein